MLHMRFLTFNNTSALEGSCVFFITPLWLLDIEYQLKISKGVIQNKKWARQVKAALHETIYGQDVESIILTGHKRQEQL